MGNILSAFDRFCRNLAVWKYTTYGVKIDLFWFLAGNFHVNLHIGFLSTEKINDINGIVP